MLSIEYTEVVGMEHAIRGMRNSFNSWDKSDSGWVEEEPGVYSDIVYDVGHNDLALMEKLVKAGTDHRKFMRMIVVYCDIVAPLYWWKQFDTYKVGTVANSCSTMHKIHENEMTLDDFSCESLSPNGKECLRKVIEELNYDRMAYIELKDERYFEEMIQLLPSSYNQRRTVMLNYEVLANIYNSRKNHKLEEWRELCHWIERLPYSCLITGMDDTDE